MRSFAKLRRDTRGLSAIFAVLLLIAIAVIAGIIIYMFTSGYMGTMMGGGTAGQEKVAVEAVEYDATAGVTLYAKSTGGGPVTVTDAILKDAQGNVVEVDTLTAAVILAPGVLGTVAPTFTLPLAPGVYTVTVITQEGNQFVSPTFKV